MNDAGTLDCDLLVAGSGAGALAAAVTAAHHGLRVVVAEKHTQLGGTTAWSGGWMWVPRNPLARAAGIRESLEPPRTYLRQELGAHYDPERVEAFLNHAPAMVEFFRRHTALEFIDGNAIPDFHGRTPGAREGGRSVCAAPFDGRRLGDILADIREPLDLVAPWGMGIASGADLRHFMNATRDRVSFGHAARRILAHWRDRLTHGRGLHLVAGNALVAALVRSALDRGVRLLTGTPVDRLLIENGRVAGARLGGATPRPVRAARGVVLACGGFPHDPGRIAQLFAHARDGRAHWSAAPPENGGDGIRLGVAAGAAIGVGAAAGAWAPVSLVRRADGSTGHFPHLIERGKPGLIAVTRAGRRFVNEADSYHDFMSALFTALPPDAPVEAWLVCDHRFIRRYGLGFARPAPFPLGSLLAEGYLRRADSLAGLARACGIDAAVFESTVERFNGGARDGVDPDFGRGETAYNRMQGDPGRSPNPCVAPIARAPYYAVRVVPGSLGTFAGLACDAHARVLDEHGAAIAGLYAAGNDMASIMGGRYPSGGITLGPAMTFGYLAAHHAAGVVPAPWPDD